MMDELVMSLATGELGYEQIQAGNKTVGTDLLTRFQYHSKQWTNIQDDFINMLTDVEIGK